jgi:hypothetical protein
MIQLTRHSTPLLNHLCPLILHRYGPWSLLCKGRSVEFPVDHSTLDIAEFRSAYQNEWLKYADHATVESSGLHDGMEVMFEYSLVGKDSIM